MSSEESHKKLRPVFFLPVCLILLFLSFGVLAQNGNNQPGLYNGNNQSGFYRENGGFNGNNSGVGQRRQTIARKRPVSAANENYVILSIGRYYGWVDGGYPFSEDHNPFIYKGRNKISVADGMHSSLLYLIGDKFAIGYDVLTYYKKTVLKRSEGDFIQEVLVISSDLLGFEYYFDPILYSDTFGLRFFTGRFSMGYSGEVYEKNGIRDQNYQASRLDIDSSANVIGFFYDDGQDDFGYRTGLHYWMANTVKKEVFDHQAGQMVSKEIKFSMLSVYFQIRFMF